MLAPPELFPRAILILGHAVRSSFPETEEVLCGRQRHVGSTALTGDPHLLCWAHRAIFALTRIACNAFKDRSLSQRVLLVTSTE